MLQTTNLFALASRIIRDRCRGRFGRAGLCGPSIPVH